VVIDRIALVTPTRIKVNEKSHGRINHYNMLKLAGVGNAISATLEFAIDKLVRHEMGKRPIDLNLSVQVSVYPKDGIRDQEDARLIRLDTIARMASEANQKEKSRLVVDDPNIFQLAPDGRPVVLEAWPTAGGKPTVTIATLFPRGDEGPVTELVTIPMDYVIDQKESLTNQFVVYCHTITPKLFDQESVPSGMNYIGITRQGWRRRFSQHLANAKAGSPLLFHRALRAAIVF
jgi:hypothetical protein